MVPDGQGILTTVPCLVFGQAMSIITKGLQYSTLMFGSLEEGRAPSSSSGSKAFTSVCIGDGVVVVMCGHTATAVIVAGILVVVVLVVVVVRVTVTGRVVVLIVEVMLSI